MTEERITYGIVENEKKEKAIIIEAGRFKDFIFKIDRLRLTYKKEDGTLKIVESYDEVADEEVMMDFQYDLVSVPEAFETNENDQSSFEELAQNILIDILTNHQELYKLESNEHSSNTEQLN